MKFKITKVVSKGRSRYVSGAANVNYIYDSAYNGGTQVINPPLPPVPPTPPPTPGEGITEAEVDKKLENYTTIIDFNTLSETVALNTDRIDTLEQGGAAGGGVTEAQMNEKLKSYAIKTELNATDDAVAYNNQWLTVLDGIVGKPKTETSEATGLVKKVDEIDSYTYNLGDNLSRTENTVAEHDVRITALEAGGGGTGGGITEEQLNRKLEGYATTVSLQATDGNVASLTERTDAISSDVSSNRNAISAAEVRLMDLEAASSTHIDSQGLQVALESYVDTETFNPVKTQTENNAAAIAALDQRAGTLANSLQTTDENVASNSQGISALNTKTDNINAQVVKNTASSTDNGKRIMDLEAASSTHIDSQGLKVALESYLPIETFNPVSKQVSYNKAAIAAQDQRIKALEDKPSTGGITEAELNVKLKDYALKTALDTTDEQVGVLDQSVTSLNNTAARHSASIETLTNELTLTDEIAEDHDRRIVLLEQGGASGGGVTMAQVEEKLVPIRESIKTYADAIQTQGEEVYGNTVEIGRHADRIAALEEKVGNPATATTAATGLMRRVKNNEDAIQTIEDWQQGVDYDIADYKNRIAALEAAIKQLTGK